jgi:squalene-hopene/tetraprenyl-beta-curcumene cyclase
MTRMVVLLTLAVAPGFAGDWSPRLAAEYMDSRQKDWFAWPRANQNATPCVSCHTNLTYLMARPALRRALGESEPTQYETGLLNMLKSRVTGTDAKILYPKAKEPIATQEVAVEAIFAALAMPESPEALDRLWKLQRADGAWDWNMANLDPWEEPESEYFGAAIAAVAASREKGAKFAANRASLAKYMRETLEHQPMQNKLMALWASSEIKDLLPKSAKASIAAEAYRTQQSDGGWTAEFLGPFRDHPNAPVSTGSNAYATAFTAFVLERAGVARSDDRLERALNWLRSHQNPETGAWEAMSMNRKYEPGSMEIRFMSDAATGYAVMALLDAK